MPWFASSPTGLPAVTVLIVAFGVFFVALLIARRRAGTQPSDGVRDRSSIAGIAVQSFGIFVVAFGPVAVSIDPLGGAALAGAAGVALLMAGAIILFHSATRAMGRNWAIVASTRRDHQLVTDGPFAAMRNPIYVALFLFTLALAVGWGHYRHLLLGVPLFWIGTMMRVRIEERMLAAQFGTAYADYCSRVRRFGIV